jgi:hypothetical protein
MNRFQLMGEWPLSFQLNVFDYDDYFYGDGRSEGLIQRLPPNAVGEFLDMPPRVSRC